MKKSRGSKGLEANQSEEKKHNVLIHMAQDSVFHVGQTFMTTRKLTQK